jgi:SAM-dependent methyltransferase
MAQSAVMPDDRRLQGQVAPKGVQSLANDGAADQATADAFASSWNNLPSGSVYTAEQVEEWLSPISPNDVCGKQVLELGCGNGSLMVHVLEWRPACIEGMELGASLRSAEANLRSTGRQNWSLRQGDLTAYESAGFDIVYSIGVLHHLRDPALGFDAVLRNTKRGGRFHCWVYAREGNALVIWLVEPIRRVASRLPWWVTKYAVATPLVVPYFLYAKLLAALPRWAFLRHLPLYEYSLWIARREFGFFRHVAFDQLVTPQTIYVERRTIERWLQDARVEPASAYVLMRNGNSWKFGGRIK